MSLPCKLGRQKILNGQYNTQSLLAFTVRLLGLTVPTDVGNEDVEDGVVVKARGELAALSSAHLVARLCTPAVVRSPAHNEL